MEKDRRYKIQQIVCRLIVCTIGILMAFSCAYRLTDEDWEKNGRVRLVLNWPGSGLQSGMTWYFYPEGSESPVIRKGDLSGYEGTLPLGHYRVAVCNTSCSNVTLEMDNGYEEACGRARQLSSLKSASLHIASPGNLYGTGSDEIEVGGRETASEELSPVSLVKTLEMNIKVTGEGDQEGLPPAVLSGRLTGVSSRVHIPSGKPLFDAPAFMTFEPEEVSEGVYTSSLTLFGLSSEEETGEPVDLSLAMTLEDGSEVTSSTDITKEVQHAFTGSLTTHVILDLVVRYDAINGMTLTLTDWKPGSNGSGIVDP